MVPWYPLALGLLFNFKLVVNVNKINKIENLFSNEHMRGVEYGMNLVLRYSILKKILCTSMLCVSVSTMSEHKEIKREYVQRMNCGSLHSHL